MEHKFELDNLISLAEKVSEKIQLLRAYEETLKIRIFSFLILISGIIVTTFLFLQNAPYIFKHFGNMYADLIYNLSLIILVALIFFSCAMCTHYFLRQKKLNLDINNEKRILQELLDLIFEYNQFISKERLSLVDQATTQIRLKRISFALE